MNYFIQGKRENGDTFVTLRDDAPDWLREAVRDAHNGDLPNDWIFYECSVACDQCEPDNEEWPHEHADGRVDIYTSELASWYADMCGSRTFSHAKEEREDAGFDSGGKIEKQLQEIQYFALRYIAQVMQNAIKENSHA